MPPVAFQSVCFSPATHRDKTVAGIELYPDRSSFAPLSAFEYWKGTYSDIVIPQQPSDAQLIASINDAGVTYGQYYTRTLPSNPGSNSYESAFTQDATGSIPSLCLSALDRPAFRLS
jgi:hypothetical protein